MAKLNRSTPNYMSKTAENLMEYASVIKGLPQNHYARAKMTGNGAQQPWQRDIESQWNLQKNDAVYKSTKFCHDKL